VTEVISSIVDEILKLHGLAAYSLVGGLAFAEAALLVGFVLPGETAVLLGGVLANQHRVSLPVIAAVAVLASCAGMIRGAGEAIFAVARTAGWLAHALEEYTARTPLRPRAVYTGPAHRQAGPGHRE